MRPTCPACGGQTCPPIGHSDILIIGEFPSWNEMQQGRPFATHAPSRNGYVKIITAGYVLRQELIRNGLDFSNFRITNLWVHEPNKSEECFKDGYDAVLDEAKGKSAILLVGSEVVETFTEYRASDVSGLQVESAVFSCPIIYAMVNPALALHRSVGEVRLGIERFCSRLSQEGLV